jgi:hypothetical protein
VQCSMVLAPAGDSAPKNTEALGFVRNYALGGLPRSGKAWTGLDKPNGGFLCQCAKASLANIIILFPPPQVFFPKSENDLKCALSRVEVSDFPSGLLSWWSPLLAALELPLAEIDRACIFVGACAGTKEGR